VQSYIGNGYGLLFHMTQLIKRSNTKRNRTISKPIVSEHKLTVSGQYLLWRALAIHLLSSFKACVVF